MKVKELAEKTANPYASVDDSADDIEAIMIARDLLSVPLVDSQGKIFGIVDLEAINCFRASDNNASHEAGWEFCKREFTTVNANAGLTEAIELLQESNETMLVIVEGDDDRFVGTLSYADVVDALNVKSAPAGSDVHEATLEL